MNWMSSTNKSKIYKSVRFALCLSSDSCNRSQTNDLINVTVGGPVRGIIAYALREKNNGIVDELILLPVYLNVKRII